MSFGSLGAVLPAVADALIRFDSGPAPTKEMI